MSLHKKDKRSKKIVFVANCILNANNKVFEFARYPGMFSEVINVLDKYGVGIIQMPCPETLYMGNQRWWCSRNLYDNDGYRSHCRALAENMAVYIGNYERVGYKIIAILTCDGSPSCGITESSYCEDWGGRPKDIPRSLVNKKGIFMEEFLKLLEEKKLPIPYVYGLKMDVLTQSNTKIFRDFENCFEKLMLNADQEVGHTLEK